MQLIVVGFGLELADGVLPIGGQDVAIAAYEALVDLQSSVNGIRSTKSGPLLGMRLRTLAHVP